MALRQAQALAELPRLKEILGSLELIHVGLVSLFFGFPLLRKDLDLFVGLTIPRSITIFARRAAARLELFNLDVDDCLRCSTGKADIEQGFLVDRGLLRPSSCCRRHTRACSLAKSCFIVVPRLGLQIGGFQDRVVHSQVDHLQPPQGDGLLHR